MRVCLIYDHLFPQTVGGAERWMRELALRAAARHEVTYLTMRHWHGGNVPELPGVRILGLTDPGRIYGLERRTLGPPLRFGLAVARHLAVHGTRYDVVHTASFPYFPLLAAAALRRRRRYRLFVDWHEVWTRAYWRSYAGSAVGTVGWAIQKACLRTSHRAFCFSGMNAERLAQEGYRSSPVRLPGIYAGNLRATPEEEVDSTLVVYAGRHIPEKRVDALVRGFARARVENPALRLELYGDGPERSRIEVLVQELGLATAATIKGKVPEEEVERALGRAACLATASEREGYGAVIVEASAHGTPSVVVDGPENAALELVEEGVNGTVARSAAPEDVADAILRTIEDGPALRESTARWFETNVPSLSVERSIELVLSAYDESDRGQTR
jgi:glycosyltransferase involved in cell wall biosynthesis